MVVLSIIRLYQHARPVLDRVCISVFGVAYHCPHTPSCSEYMIKKVTNHGTIVGLFLGGKRIATCIRFHI